jgi:hypothetical protein
MGSKQARTLVSTAILDLDRRSRWMVVAVSIEDLQWRTVPVRLELTVWRP